MEKFIWASAHKPTPEQLQECEGGDIIYLPVELQSKLNNTPASLKELIELADELTRNCRNLGGTILVQPGGSPAFQAVLGTRNTWIPMWYAHSERVSQDEPQADGSIKKISIFKHVKFIEV